MTAALAALQLVLAGGPAAAPATPATHVEAATVEYLYRERRAILTGQPLVTLRREDATLVCRRMVADTDDAGELRRAVCEGDVRLTRGAHEVTCQRATYDAVADTLVCRGEPVLRDGPSELRCEEVVYDLAADRVTARHGKGVLFARPGQRLPGAEARGR